MNIYMTAPQARRYNRLCNRAVQARREEGRAEQDLLALVEERLVLQWKVNKCIMSYGHAKIRHERIKIEIRLLLEAIKEKNADTAERRKAMLADDVFRDLTHRELGILLRDRDPLPILPAHVVCTRWAAQKELKRRRKEKKAEWLKTQQPKPECSRGGVAMAIVNSTHPFWAHYAPRVYAGWPFEEACASLHLPVSEMNVQEVAIALFRGEIDLPLSRRECHEAYKDKINHPREEITSLQVDCLAYHIKIAKRRLLAARGDLR